MCDLPTFQSNFNETSQSKFRRHYVYITNVVMLRWYNTTVLELSQYIQRTQAREGMIK